MNNPEATRIVREQLAAARIDNARLDVRSRDVTSRVTGSWDTLAMVRTSVYMVDDRPMPDRVGAHLARTLRDLPGANPDIRVTDLNVVVFWNGGV